MGNRQRKEERAKNRDPINFTCGGCKKVFSYDKENHLICPECNYGKKDGGA